MRVIFQMFYDPLQGKKVDFNVLYVNFIFNESFCIYYNIEDCKDCKARFTTGPLIDLRFEIWSSRFIYTYVFTFLKTDY